MRTLLDFSLQYFDLFLIGILILLVAFITSIFFKKRRTIIIVMAVLIIGTTIFVNQTKYTTLLELYSDQLNENTVVKSVAITINDQSKSMPEKLRSVTIEKEEIIEQIIKEFSGIKLKKEDDVHQLYLDYHIEIVVTNQIKDDHFSTTIIGLDLNKNYLNDYKIISETNHLKTIESLVKMIK